ncbi:hypothetical protein [Halomarina rubra]|uniref:Restriction endonuclease n=1 Tax=Halomarina rubra TaxID=2071873 RepID=A0ABD6AYV0_9EURY|nr:hypothetical protein [Halomarina rubra]
MEYPPTDELLPHMPPNDPWENHEVAEGAQSYLTLYYSEDEISKYPVREVTRVNDNKSDPNLETMSYGLCSTCTRDIRSGLVKNGRPYLFFCTNFRGKRHLTGYYHIGWHSLGPPLLTNFSNGSIRDDYRLVADEVKFVYPPISFDEIAEEYGFTDIQSGFRKKLISSDEAELLLSILDQRDDRTGEYISEIERLEQINNRYHEYRYPTWERESGFNWETVQDYVGTENADDDDAVKRILENRGAEVIPKLGSISYEQVSDWHCLVCEYEFENNAPLKLCPNCNNGGGIIPETAI